MHGKIIFCFESTEINFGKNNVLCVADNTTDIKFYISRKHDWSEILW